MGNETTDVVKPSMDALRRMFAGRLMAWRQNTGRRGGITFGLKGTPDILGVLKPGRAFAIECKTAKGKLSADQEAWRAMFEAAGGLYAVARSAQEAVDAVRAWLAEKEAA